MKTRDLEPLAAVIAQKRVMDRKACLAMQSILDGTPRLEPATFAAYGEWQPALMMMGGMYALAGVKAARVYLQVMAPHDDALVKLMEGAGKDGKAARQRRMSELARIPRTKLREVAPGLLPYGVTLLTGAAGVDLTTLAWKWAVAVAGAGRLEGVRQVQHGPVLYLALEQPEEAMEQRVQRLRGRAQRALRVKSEWPALHKGGLFKLVGRVARKRLLVIDSFSAAMGAVDATGEMPTMEEVQETLARLHALAMATRMAILLVDRHGAYAEAGGEAVDVEGELEVFSFGFGSAHARGQIARVLHVPSVGEQAGTPAVQL